MKVSQHSHFIIYAARAHFRLSFRLNLARTDMFVNYLEKVRNIKFHTTIFKLPTVGQEKATQP